MSTGICWDIEGNILSAWGAGAAKARAARERMATTENCMIAKWKCSEGKKVVRRHVKNRIRVERGARDAME